MTVGGRRPQVAMVGGDDVHLRLPLIRELDARDVDVILVGSGEASRIYEAGVPFFAYDLHRWVSPLRDLRTTRELGGLFRRIRPDIVHAFDTKPSIFAMYAAEQASVRRRMRTITGMGYLYSSSSPLALFLRPVHDLLQKRAGAISTLTVFQNEDDRRYFRDRGLVTAGADELVRGSGVDLEQFDGVVSGGQSREEIRESLGLAADDIVVILVSRLVEQKGIREYVSAAEQVQGQTTGVRFLLVGPSAGEGRHAVPEEWIRRQQSIRWLGRRDDIPSLLRASDVFVFPSTYREGVPRVLLEAGAANLPTVSTDMPGCRDVVIDEWNGFLVPAQSPGSIAGAILRLARSPQERAIMGKRSAHRVRDLFSLSTVADSYASIYQNLVSE